VVEMQLRIVTHDAHFNQPTSEQSKIYHMTKRQQ